LDAYLAVLGAQLKAIESAKSGMTGKEIDGVARDFLKEKQLDGYFGHGLGHGLGMDVHESPFLNKRYDKPINDMAVVTFEPGVYIPGEFGIRIEDDVLLTENGHEVLSNFKKEFTVI
ncbi:M24 family metallopeptidase, partial [Athalassotoga sp.]|uniref:M24 family metallopeptidase n=1 Tax=Athalassotoga sp. TaxID=2022597 RepID=UPI003D082814